jgi:TonB family protein
VTSVEIKKSCGHKILDQAGADAFARWRFKPGSAPKIKCPITWVPPKSRR